MRLLPILIRAQMTVEIKRSIVSVLIRGRQFSLVSGVTGFLTENGRLKMFSTVEDARKFCGDVYWIYPESGYPVDIEFARHWIKESSKPATLEILNKLLDVDAVYMDIHLAYSDYKPEDVPPDLMKEFLRSNEATFSGKRDMVRKLSTLSFQQIGISISREQGWDTEKLIHGWGGEMRNEWTQHELDQLGSELTIEIEFIENTLQKYGSGVPVSVGGNL